MRQGGHVLGFGGASAAGLGLRHGRIVTRIVQGLREEQDVDFAQQVKARNSRTAYILRALGVVGFLWVGQTTESASVPGLAGATPPPSPLPPLPANPFGPWLSRVWPCNGLREVIMRTQLYVGNLASHADPRGLRGLFLRHGTVVRAQVFETGDVIHRRGGFGIVQMDSHEEAAAALAALDGAEALGGVLAVRWASPHEQTDAGHPRMFGTMNMTDDGETAARQ